jgi:hypothetical protein
MSTPMDIDPPAASASAPADNTTVDEVKGKGKEEKPRFEVKKVRMKHIGSSTILFINKFSVECRCSLGLGYDGVQQLILLQLTIALPIYRYCCR